jgi:hypothetical protein
MRMVNADLHNHLRTSSDMRGIVNLTIDIAQKRLGFGGIIGLINFGDERYESFSEQHGYLRNNLRNALFFPEKDILVIKGEEIATKQGHLLVLGIESGKHLKQKRTLEDTISEAKDNNGIIIADHPYYYKGIGEYLELHQEVLNDINAIEIHNGEASFSFFGLIPRNANQRAQNFYDGVSHYYPKLGALSTSDGHSLYELGRSWTKMEMPDRYSSIKGQEKLIETIRRALIEPLMIPAGYSMMIRGISQIELERKQKYEKTNCKIGTAFHIGAMLSSRVKRFAKRQ